MRTTIETRIPAEPTRDPDTQLFLQWRAGDRRAGGRLVRKFDPVLARYFARRFSSDHGDLVQRTWLALAEALPRYRGETSFHGFCMGVARNITLEEIRRRRRATPEVEERLMPSAVADPEDWVATGECVGQLEVALLTLEPGMFRVIELSYWAEFGGPEIGRAMGILPNTVRSRLRRAHGKLRAWWSG